MKKFLTSTICRIILISILAVAGFFSLGIWIPELEMIVNLEQQNITGGYLGLINDYFSAGLWNQALVLIFNIVVVALAGLLTISMIVPILRILISKELAKSKKLFIGRFVLLFMILAIVSFQINEKSFLNEIFIKKYEISLSMTIISIFLLIGYIVLFFILNKIQVTVNKSVDKKNNSQDFEINNKNKSKLSTTETINFKTETITKLKVLLDNDAITKKEFEKEKEKILSE